MPRQIDPPNLREIELGPEDVFCRRCGYQLFGVASDTCPECGTPFDRRNPDTFESRRSLRGARGARQSAVLVTSGYLSLLAAVASFRLALLPARWAGLLTIGLAVVTIGLATIGVGMGHRALKEMEGYPHSPIRRSARATLLAGYWLLAMLCFAPLLIALLLWVL